MVLVRDYDPVTGQATYREQLDRPKAAFTTAQRDALRGVQLWTGRIIYNTTTAGLEFYNGTAWTTLVVTPPTWIDVTFLNSWVNYGSGLQTVQYRKEGDRVFVRGTMKNGTVAAVPAFTLPVGFRPPAHVGYVNANTAAGAAVVVSCNSTGDVDVEIGNNTLITLNFDFSVTA